MISQRIRGLYDLFVLVQAGLALVFYWLHLLAIERFYSEIVGQWNYLIYSVLMLLGILMEAIHRYNYDTEWFQKDLLQKHRIALRQTAFAAAPVVFFLVAAKDQGISRTFLFSFLPVLYLVLLLSSWKLPQVVANLIFDHASKDKTLLIGSSKKTLDLSDWLARKVPLGLEAVGVLCDEKLQMVGAFPVLGRVEDLERVIRREKITQVILVELPTFSIFLSKLTRQCELLGVRLLVMSDLEEKFRHQVVYMENDGRHFFGLRQEPLENPFNRAVKRSVDLAVCLPVLLFLLPPICLVVWILHRLQSRGPLFYSQTRSGLQNRPFQILKFRTMHPNQQSAARQASAQDKRIFPAGLWLRKWSIDELPQFWNVLRGEMSVVGPRPHLPEHNEYFSRMMKNYFIRSSVKPGITGLAQVRGFRGEAKEEELLKKRIESDISYLENWSLSMDLLIMVRTAWQMVFPPKSAG